MLLRRIHAYLSILVAPSLLFFALTGALQLFDLHEAHGTYRPPVVIEKLSRLHKDQLFALRPHEDPPGAEAHDEPAVPATTRLLKWVFLAATLGFVTSTTLGLWLGLRQTRRRLLAWILLSAGIAVPLIPIVAGALP